MRKASRILAIEPDPERGRILKESILDGMGAEVVLTTSAEAAIAVMAGRGVDVILTSALLSPRDDSQLTAHLKRSAYGPHVFLLTIPPVVDPKGVASGRKGGLLPSFKRRPAPLWPPYSLEMLRARIKDALEDSDSVRRIRPPLHLPAGQDTVDPFSLADMRDDDLRDYCGVGIKRLRAQRWMISDVPWLSSVKLPWGLEVQLLNISSSGLLVESGTKFMLGSSTEFKLWGPNKELIVPARVVRSHVAAVDARGVKYHAAAVFDRNVELLVNRRRFQKGSPGSPTALAEVLNGVRDQAQRGAAPAVLRTLFERGVQHLVTAREIRIREVPVVENNGCDSIYFTVQTENELPAVLQVTFEPNYEPRKEEFEVLEAAATLAADVLRIIEASRNASLATLAVA